MARPTSPTDSRSPRSNPAPCCANSAIAALIASQAADYNACAITDALHELASRIGEAGKDIRKGCEAIAKTIKEGGE